MDFPRVFHVLLDDVAEYLNLSALIKFTLIWVDEVFVVRQMVEHEGQLQDRISCAKERISAELPDNSRECRCSDLLSVKIIPTYRLKMSRD